MTLQEIKTAVDEGKTVCWYKDNYIVIDGKKAGYLIKCTYNDYCIGLTWADGSTMNGKESEFYIKED